MIIILLTHSDKKITIERTQLAIKLFRQSFFIDNKECYLICCTSENKLKIVEPYLMGGIPRERLMYIDNPNTVHGLVGIKMFFEENQINEELIFVTSDFHKDRLSYISGLLFPSVKRIECVITEDDKDFHCNYEQVKIIKLYERNYSDQVLTRV